MCNKLDISNSSLWQVKLCNAYSANNGREGDPVTIALRDFIKIVSMRLNKRINDDNKSKYLLYMYLYIYWQMEIEHVFIIKMLFYRIII